MLCSVCKTLFYLEVASPEMLFEYYKNYYQSNNLLVPQVAVRSLERTVLSFEPYRSSVNSICDIGFGAGTLLDAASQLGWLSFGTEYSEEAISMALRKGWRVHKGDLIDGFLDGPFDVLTIVETLEHVQNPKELLSNSKKRLRAGGLLYGTTPNASSLNRRLLGGKWNVVSFPEHPVLLSTKGLKRLLKELGYTKIEIHSTGFNPFDLLSQVRVLKPKTAAPEFVDNPRVECGYRLNQSMTGHWHLRMVKSLVNYLLKISRLGDGLVFRAERSSD